MVLYEGLELAELEFFCRNRGLTLPSDKTCRLYGRRRETIRLLEEADRNRKFDKLVELAPEMRLKIYEFYFTRFLWREGPNKDGAVCASVPPLCRATHVLRKEALPVYFSYPILLDVWPSWRQADKDKAIARFGITPGEMGKRIMTMPDHLFQHVRQVSIVPHLLFTGIAKTHWIMKLDAKKTSSQVSTVVQEIEFVGTGPINGSESEQSAETREVERGLQMLTAEIVGRDGTFRQEDMQKIPKIFQETWESRQKMLDDGKLRSRFDDLE